VENGLFLLVLRKMKTYFIKKTMTVAVTHLFQNSKKEKLSASHCSLPGLPFRCNPPRTVFSPLRKYQGIKALGKKS